MMRNMQDVLSAYVQANNGNIEAAMLDFLKKETQVSHVLIKSVMDKFRETGKTDLITAMDVMDEFKVSFLLRGKSPSSSNEKVINTTQDPFRR